MQQLKVAFIGLDHVHATQMYHAIAGEERMHILGMADFLSKDKETVDRKVQCNCSQAMQEKVKLYYDFEQLLEQKPDVVFVNAGVASHAEAASALLGHDLHVVIEKPMCFSVADAKTMYKAAAMSKGELIINWPVAYFPAYNKVKELLDAGAVGEVLRIQYRSPATRGPYPLDKYTPRQLSDMWWYKHAEGGGSIMDYAGYGCLLTTYLAGEMAKRVYGLKKNFFLPFSDVEDYAVFTLDFGSKVGLIEGSWSTVSNGEIVTGPVVYGREGVITADRFDSKVKLYKDFVPYRPSPPPNEVFDTPMQESGAMAKELCAHFLDGAPLHELLTLAFNMKAQAALCAGIRSCESGRAEDVEDPFSL